MEQAEFLIVLDNTAPAGALQALRDATRVTQVLPPRLAVVLAYGAVTGAAELAALPGVTHVYARGEADDVGEAGAGGGGTGGRSAAVGTALGAGAGAGSEPGDGTGGSGTGSGADERDAAVGTGPEAGGDIGGADVGEAGAGRGGTGPELDARERQFVSAWLSRRSRASRAGDGLDWNAPGFRPPDRPGRGTA